MRRIHQIAASCTPLLENPVESTVNYRMQGSKVYLNLCRGNSSLKLGDVLAEQLVEAPDLLLVDLGEVRPVRLLQLYPAQ